MRLVRKLYDWVLQWAETPYGGPALFLLALVESSIFPVPPDVLLIALCIALPSRAWRFASAGIGRFCVRRADWLRHRLGGLAGCQHILLRLYPRL